MIAPARPRVAPADVPRRVLVSPKARAFQRLPQPEPAHVGAELVLIEDRYLRFCSFLS